MRSRLKKRDGNINAEIKTGKYSKLKYMYEMDMKESEPFKQLMNETDEKNVGKKIDKLIDYIINSDLCPTPRDLFILKQRYIEELLRIKTKYKLNSPTPQFFYNRKKEREYLAVVNGKAFFILED